MRTRISVPDAHDWPPHPDQPDGIRFLDFSFDRRGGRLLQNGETVPLRPKTWAVLLYLVERPGVLVSREELLDAVWPNVAVTPDTLSKSIAELRVALGDDCKQPRCIETVHRRGFRFIADTGTEPKAPTPAHPAASNPVFVGRHAERQKLKALFAKACAGQRQVVFITAPTGGGKTALVDAFLDSLADQGGATPVWIARAQCVEQYGMREPYMPMLDALERLTRRPDAAPLLEVLHRVAPTWLVQMPWLLAADSEGVRHSVEASRPDHMLREFAVFTEAVTSKRTIVLVLEDLHWSDAATVNLLSVLAQRPDPARMLVIGTYLPAEIIAQEHVLSAAVRALQLHRQCIELPLHDLTRDEVQEYVDVRFHRPDFSSELASVLYKYTDGTPLFVIGTVEHLLANDIIAESGSGWVLHTAPKDLNLEAPDDVRHIIALQLQRLSPSDLKLLEAGSVAGEKFAVPVVAAALGCEAAVAETRCEALVRACGFLRSAGSTEWPDGYEVQCYAFSHELYRRTIYVAIPERARQQLHQRVGEALEAAYGEDTADIMAELAHHFECAHNHQRAEHYLAALAVRARQRFANREAAGYLESALRLLPRLGDDAEPPRRELDLRIQLAPVLNDLHGMGSEPVRVNCERAHDLCLRVGSPAQRFQLAYTRFHLYGIRADATLTAEAVTEMDELARSLGTAEYRVAADSAAIRHAFLGGRFAEACRLAETRLPDPTSPALPPLVGADPVIAAMCHYANALWFIGQTDRANTTMQASLAAVERSDSPLSRATALGHACLLAVFSRQVARLRELLGPLASMCAEHSIAYWAVMALAFSGWVRIQDGEIGEGISELLQARGSLTGIGATIFSTHICAFLAEAYLAIGQTDAGTAVVDEGLGIAYTTLDRMYAPELWRLRGELLLCARVAPRRNIPSGCPSPSDSRWHDAERCLLRALEVARQSDAKSLELRAATSLARARQEHGNGSQARTLLTDLCRWFGPNADSPDLMQARSLLDVASPASKRARVTAKSSVRH